MVKNSKSNPKFLMEEKSSKIGKRNEKIAKNKDVVQNSVMDEKVVQNIVMDEKVVQNIVMGAKIDPNVVMDLSVFFW